MDRWQKVVVGLCLAVFGLEGIFLMPGSTSGDGHGGGDEEEDNALSSSFAFFDSHNRRLAANTQNNAAIETVSSNRTNILINVGLPRTGANALYAYAKCQGWSNVHLQNDCRSAYKTCAHCFADNLQQGRYPPWQNCSSRRQQDTYDYNSSTERHQNTAAAFFQIDVESAQPYSWFLPQYGTALPSLAHDNVLWILPLRRDATVWAESVLHWHSVTQRLRHAFQLQKDEEEEHGNNKNNNHDKSPQTIKNVTVELPQPVTYEQVVQDLEVSLERIRGVNRWYQRRKQFIEAYEAHTRHVQQTAQMYGIPLITVILDDKVASEKTTSGTTWQSQLTRHGWMEKKTTASHNCWQGPREAQRLDTDWQDFTLNL
jgi:hypothetical protein